MIILDELTKVARNNHKNKKFLSSVSLEIPSDRRIALLGPDQDRRILINILAGQEMPTSGRVLRKASLSFPVGQLPGFSRDLSLRVNVAHVARLYGADVRQTVDLVESVLSIGASFDRPYDDISSKMRRPLAQIVAFALPFDAYLLTDDRIRRSHKSRRGKRDEDFSGECYALFEARSRTSGMIIPTDDIDFAREHCEIGMVIRRGQVELIEDFEEAFRRPRRERRESD